MGRRDRLTEYLPYKISLESVLGFTGGRYYRNYIEYTLMRYVS